MANKTQIRRAIIDEIEDLEMTAIMRDRIEVVAQHTESAKQYMSDGDEPAALKALYDGVWVLAKNDPWEEKKNG